MGIVRCSSFCLLLLMFLIPNVFGAGFTFDGLGVKARGMGGAFRAVADDWSATYYNPAGLNRIQDNYIASNLTLFHNRYTVVPNITWDGYESGFLNNQEAYNEHEILNIPQGGFLFRLPVLNETMFGLTAMQTFDEHQSWELYSLPLGYSKVNLPTRQFSNDLDVVAFQLSMAKGFMEDRLSVGIGLSILRGDLSFTNTVLRDNPLDTGAYALNDRPADKIPEWYGSNGKGWGFGYKAGLIYEFNEKLDVALVFTGKSSITLSGKTDFIVHMKDDPIQRAGWPTQQDTEDYYFISGDTLIAIADFETVLDLPASIGVGLAYDLSDKLTLSADAEYTFWSTFKGLEFDFDENSFTGLADEDFIRINGMVMTDLSVPADWQDGGRLMVGANYQYKDFVALRCGFGVDQTIVSAETFVPQFIDLTTKYSYSLGIGFNIDFWQLDLATTYTHHGDLSVPWRVEGDDGLLDNIAGDYQADNYQTILGISYRF